MTILLSVDFVSYVFVFKQTKNGFLKNLLPEFLIIKICKNNLTVMTLIGVVSDSLDILMNNFENREIIRKYSAVVGA
jgi:hypothetical protein